MKMEQTTAGVKRVITWQVKWIQN